MSTHACELIYRIWDTRTHTVGLGVSVVEGCRSMETTDWLVSAAEKRIALGPKLLYSTTLTSNTHTHSYRHAAEHTVTHTTQSQNTQTMVNSTSVSAAHTHTHITVRGHKQSNRAVRAEKWKCLFD